MSISMQCCIIMCAGNLKAHEAKLWDNVVICNIQPSEWWWASQMNQGVSQCNMPTSLVVPWTALCHHFAMISFGQLLLKINWCVNCSFALLFHKIVSLTKASILQLCFMVCKCASFAFRLVDKRTKHAFTTCGAVLAISFTIWHVTLLCTHAHFTIGHVGIGDRSPWCS